MYPAFAGLIVAAFPFIPSVRSAGSALRPVVLPIVSGPALFSESNRKVSGIPALQRPAAELRVVLDDVTPVLERSVHMGEEMWCDLTTLSDSCCIDAAPKCAFVLRGRGFPVDHVRAEKHSYVLWGQEAGNIFIDPTVRQFFGGREAPATVPKIFSGTLADLERLFREHHQSQSDQLIQAIYFNQAAVTNLPVQWLAGPKKDLDHVRILADFIAGGAVR